MGLQMSAGNQAVQRLIQRRAGALIQREGTLYLDGSGVAHKEPDPSKAPSVIHVDSAGVGHAHPDQSKAPPVLFMDEEGVGHKTPDPSTTPEVLHMDESGVAHAKPDEVDAEVAAAKAVVLMNTAMAGGLITGVVKGMEPWPARLALAEAKRDEAEQAYLGGKSNWNAETATSGEWSATFAEQAEALVPEAQAFHDTTEPEHVKVKAAHTQLGPVRNAYIKNYKRFRLDRARWLPNASPMTKAAIKEMGESLAATRQPIKDAVEAGKTADGLFGKFKAAWDKAADFADKAWAPLRSPPTAAYVIVGQLQQKLNATRPDGAARLPVHALFNDATLASLQAFQGANGLAATGKADSATWTELNTQAPSVMQNGKLVVEAKGGAQAVTALNGALHPELGFGSSGMAVKELQQRLNNWCCTHPEGARPFTLLTVDGSFGFRDRWAVQAFQKAHGLPETGSVANATWVEIDKVAGGITGGTREFGWRESVEGMNNVGGTASFDWEAKDSNLTITVNIKFTGSTSHPMLATWLQDIRDVWNNYKAVEQNVPVPREVNITFKPVQANPAKHTVKIGEPTAANPNPRSDAANWYVNDNRRGLAPHEFGHLIGLEDEYNRPEEQGVAASGLEPTVGQVASTSGAGARAVADQIHTILTGNADKTGDQRLGLVVAKLREHGVQQGAFARLVATRYESAHGFGGEADIASYFAKHNGKDWTTNLTRATAPFLTSNASLMGTMSNNMGRDQDMAALAPHDHPVQPRHVRDFANLMTLVFPGTTWKPARR